jgi:hypothetical protein
MQLWCFPLRSCNGCTETNAAQHAPDVRSQRVDGHCGVGAAQRLHCSVRGRTVGGHAHRDGSGPHHARRAQHCCTCAVPIHHIEPRATSSLRDSSRGSGKQWLTVVAAASSRGCQCKLCTCRDCALASSWEQHTTQDQNAHCHPQRTGTVLSVELCSTQSFSSCVPRLNSNCTASHSRQ